MVMSNKFVVYFNLKEYKTLVSEQQKFDRNRTKILWLQNFEVLEML